MTLIRLILALTMAPLNLRHLLNKSAISVSSQTNHLGDSESDNELGRVQLEYYEEVSAKGLEDQTSKAAIDTL